MNTRLTILLAGAAAVVASATFAGPLTRARYETPKYQVETKDGAFEIRKYPAVVIASAGMTTEARAQDSTFMQLFKYISGENEKGRKIKMTTPVFTTTEGSGRVMSFVVPVSVVKDGVPRASNSNIVTTERAAGRFAVYRYSGRWTESREATARERLIAWAKENGLELIGSFEKANYDPPFTPPVLRRNEILFRIRE